MCGIWEPARPRRDVRASFESVFRVAPEVCSPFMCAVEVFLYVY